MPKAFQGSFSGLNFFLDKGILNLSLYFSIRRTWILIIPKHNSTIAVHGRFEGKHP